MGARGETIVVLPEIEVLQALFARYGVRFAYLFGSRARQQESASSDVDIACWYDEEDCLARFQTHCALEEELKRLFPVPLDLLILNDAKPLLQGEAVLKGKLLFPEPDEEVVRFESKIRQRCEDYAYSQRFFTRARLSRQAAG